MSLIFETDCSAIIKGTGTKGCQQFINNIPKWLLIERGFKIAPEDFDSVDDAYWENLIQTGKLVVIPEPLTQANEDMEVVYETVGRTEIPVVGTKLKRMFTYSFNTCLARGLNSLKGKQWDVWGVDSDGTLVGYINKDGFFTGFPIERFVLDALNIGDGTSIASKMMAKLFFTQIGSDQFFEAVKTDPQYDFLTLDGVNDVALGVVEYDANRDLFITVKISCDNSTNVEGLTISDFVVKNATGNIQVITDVTYQNGVYKIDFDPELAIGDYTIELNGTVIVGQDFYKGNIANFTAT